MFPGAFQHGGDGINRVKLFFFRRIDRTTIDANSNRTVVFEGNPCQILDLFLPRLFSLVVVQMAWIVANFIDKRGNDLCQPIIFL